MSGEIVNISVHRFTLYAWKNELGQYLMYSSWTTHTGHHVEIKFTDKLSEAFLAGGIHAFDYSHRKNIQNLKLKQVEVQMYVKRAELEYVEPDIGSDD